MRSFLRSFIGPLRSWVYWQVMNLMRETCVEGTGVSPRARIGRRAIVRRGTEVYSDVILGDFSYISGPRTYVESARIGKFCSIARQTIIGVGNHDHSLVTTHPFLISPEFGGIVSTRITEQQRAAPIIGHDVWIGINSIVMRGVTIGDGAVVAANSVVTKNVDPYSIVAGTPAKHLKYRFNENIILALLRIKWWDWDKDKIQSNLEEFKNIEVFVKKHDPK